MVAGTEFDLRGIPMGAEPRNIVSLMNPLLVGHPVLETLGLSRNSQRGRMWVFGSKRRFFKVCGHQFSEISPIEKEVVLAVINKKQRKLLSWGYKKLTDTLDRKDVCLGIYGVGDSHYSDNRAGVAHLRKSVELERLGLIYVPVTVYEWGNN